MWRPVPTVALLNSFPNPAVFSLICGGFGWARGLLEASVVLTEGTLLGLVDHGEHTSDVLAHNLNLRELGGSTTGHLHTAGSHGEHSLQILWPCCALP